MQSLNSQKGAVLIISLVLLIIMTLLGLSSMSNTVMEERMAGNQRNSDLAFQAAESALRGGETAVFGWPDVQGLPDGDNGGTNNTTNKGVFTIDSSGSGGLDPNGSNNTEWWEERDGTWWATNATAYANTLNFQSGQSLTSPRYILQKVSQFTLDNTLSTGGVSQSIVAHYYQVTARGTGSADQAESFLRSVYVRFANQ